MTPTATRTRTCASRPCSPAPTPCSGSSDASFGVVELVGVAFFLSIGLLLAAYVMREWQRDRTALICIAGAFPLPVTIISLFV